VFFTPFCHIAIQLFFDKVTYEHCLPEQFFATAEKNRFRTETSLLIACQARPVNNFAARGGQRGKGEGGTCPQPDLFYT
jgi:hypothetical protein